MRFYVLTAALQEEKGSAVIRKIGITGSIASGKSRVAEMLAGMLACVHIDADVVSSRLLERDAEGWRAFTKVFGGRYLADDGSIDRPLLRKDLFNDKNLRRQVNNIIHPLVKKAISVQMDNAIESGNHARVLVEVPLLFEAHWENLFDTVVVVYADYDTCLKRLMDRDGVPRNTAVKELKSQLPLAEKVRRADHVIDNGGKLSETTAQVKTLADLLSRKRLG